MAKASPDNILIDRNFLFKNERNILLSVLKEYDLQNGYQSEDGLYVGYDDLSGDPIKISAVPYMEPYAKQSALESLDILIERIKQRLEYRYGQRLHVFKPLEGRIWRERNLPTSSF
jgi:hypothetical protein